jgi:hypothetical protein
MKGTDRGTDGKAELVFGLTRLAGLPQEGNSSHSPTWVASEAKGFVPEDFIERKEVKPIRQCRRSKLSSDNL